MNNGRNVVKLLKVLFARSLALRTPLIRQLTGEVVCRRLGYSCIRMTNKMKTQTRKLGKPVVQRPYNNTALLLLAHGPECCVEHGESEECTNNTIMQTANNPQESARNRGQAIVGNAAPTASIASAW